MKYKITYAFMMIILMSCETREARETIDEEFDTKESKEKIYEGRIPLDDERRLSMVLTLKPGAVQGEGHYQLEETMEASLEQVTYDPLNGNYKIFQDNERTILYLENSIRIDHIKRTFYNAKTKKINEENLRAKDLSFVRDGNQLIVLDTRTDPVTQDYNENLIERSSRLFTVEGYFQFKGDTSVFFEMNTNAHLPLSKRGAYHQAAQQYHLLANKKFESLYLKGTGYFAEQQDAHGNAVEMLVLKRIIQMNSSTKEE